MQGEAPRVVSWLAGQAGPGEVLASEATWRQVRGAFETEALGARDFTGLGRQSPCPSHRVLREREVRVRFERTLRGRWPHAAGGARARAGATAGALGRGAEGGQGAFVLLRGEAGIGKSRLLQELRERVPPETATCLRFQCWSRLGASVLPPVAEVLQRLAPVLPGGHAPAAPGGAGGAAGRDGPARRGPAVAGPAPRAPRARGRSRCTGSRPSAGWRRRTRRWWACSCAWRGSARCSSPWRTCTGRTPPGSSCWACCWSASRERACSSSSAPVPSSSPPGPAHARLHRLALERLPPGLAAELVKQVAGER